MRDPYTVLGVPRGASDDQIKRAYRDLAKRHHPDRHPDDAVNAERFKEISAAYDILGDKDKRGKFDRGEIDASGNVKNPFAGARRGTRGRQGAGTGDDPFSGFGFGFGGRGGDDAEFEDIFGDFFSQRRAERRKAPQKGKDLHYELTVGFMEAVKGGTRRLNLSGGKILDVKIPPGIQSGQSVRLKSQGMDGLNGGQKGDGLVKITVTDDARFARKGDDVEVEAPVGLSTAVLGGKINVETVDGAVAVTVPKNSSSGTRLRLKGKGTPKRGGGRGDQYVVLKIVLPDPPDPDLEAFLAKRRDRFDTTA